MEYSLFHLAGRKTNQNKGGVPCAGEADAALAAGHLACVCRIVSALVAGTSVELIAGSDNGTGSAVSDQGGVELIACSGNGGGGVELIAGTGTGSGVSGVELIAGSGNGGGGGRTRSSTSHLLR